DVNRVIRDPFEVVRDEEQIRRWNDAASIALKTRMELIARLVKEAVDFVIVRDNVVHKGEVVPYERVQRILQHLPHAVRHPRYLRRQRYGIAARQLASDLRNIDGVVAYPFE